MKTLTRVEQSRGAVSCILAGMFVITLQDTTVKWLSPDYALHQIMLTRSVIALGITLAFLRFEGGFRLLRTRFPGLHMARGALLVGTSILFFLAIAAMPLGEAVALFFVAPLFITILSVLVLAERVGARRWGAVLVGFAGVAVMMRPGGDVFAWESLLPIGAALGYAAMQMLTRRLGATDRASAMAFYLQLSFIGFSLAVGLAVGDGRFAGTGNLSLDFLLRAWRWPETNDLWLFGWCGISSGVAGYLLSQAYRLGEAALVAPFEYSALPMAVAWGFLFWGDLPDGSAIVGMALILAAGAYILYRENRRRRLRPHRRSAPQGDRRNLRDTGKG